MTDAGRWAPIGPAMAGRRHKELTLRRCKIGRLPFIFRGLLLGEYQGLADLLNHVFMGADTTGVGTDAAVIDQCCEAVH